MNEIEDILDIANEDARSFFLRGSSYCNINLPIYYNFDSLIKSLHISNLIPDGALKISNAKEKTKYITYTNFLRKKEEAGVNYLIYSNKNGFLTWRPLELINPVAYVYLVNIITSKKNWAIIQDRFRLFQSNKNIICCSIPNPLPQPEASTENSILNWKKSFEKEAIKQSQRFNYLLSTDITNYYGSIYTHSIAWALCPGGRTGAKQDHSNNHFWNLIDSTLCDISNRQTNGIPQGSVLMDFIAEAILGYADLCLSEKIEKDNHIKPEDYKILRYRDDYRIFAKTKITLLKIAKYLSEVLANLNLKLNESKTFLSEDIITSSQKEDAISRRDIDEKDNIESRILQIHSFSKKHPNSGSLKSMLSSYIKALNHDFLVDKDLGLISSVSIDIAFRNPVTTLI